MICLLVDGLDRSLGNETNKGQRSFTVMHSEAGTAATGETDQSNSKGERLCVAIFTSTAHLKKGAIEWLL